MHHPKAVACRHHYQGIQSKESVLRATEYRQMAGRAGRAGIDTQGEAILLANNPQLGKQLLELMQVQLVVCTSMCTLEMGLSDFDSPHMYMLVLDCYSHCICMCVCVCVCACMLICTGIRVFVHICTYTCTCAWYMMLEGLHFRITLTSWYDMSAFSILHDYRVPRVPEP